MREAGSRENEFYFFFFPIVQRGVYNNSIKKIRKTLVRLNEMGFFLFFFFLVRRGNKQKKIISNYNHW